eukprot:2972109-Pleurochrysis_carterae.AAC.1
MARSPIKTVVFTIVEIGTTSNTAADWMHPIGLWGISPSAYTLYRCKRLSVTHLGVQGLICIIMLS